MAMRTVVVTGGTSGVGRAVTRAFASRGDRVIVLARGADGLAATAAETGAEPVECDVSDAAQVDALDLGPVDVWVNNAMVSVFAPFQEMTPEEFEQVLRVVYLGSVNGTRAALRTMVPRDKGVVVQVGSALSYRGIPLQSAYCGAKHAINGFLDSVRCELLHDRSAVKVTQVQLPAVNTPQFDVVRNKLGKHGQPVPPIYSPDLVARAVLWAADHPRREYWLGASTVGTILGQRLAPWLLDRYLARTGYDSQQVDLPMADGDYVDGPLPGDRGAHGAFTDKEHKHDPLWPLSQLKSLVRL